MIECEGLRLVKPSLEFEAEYAAMVREFLATKESWFNNFELALADFPAFVQELARRSAGHRSAARSRARSKATGWQTNNRPCSAKSACAHT